MSKDGRFVWIDERTGKEAFTVRHGRALGLLMVLVFVGLFWGGLYWIIFR